MKPRPPLPAWYVTYQTASGDRHGQFFWTELAAVNFACDARKPKVEHRQDDIVPLGRTTAEAATGDIPGRGLKQ